MDITIREIQMSDISAICHIHRNDDDPWREEASCHTWVSKRLSRGFYMQAALAGGKMAGHGEWIISDEPQGRFLYLGMLQADDAYQRIGVGRAMVADGIRYAREHGCSHILTIPDTDTGSENFYAKCDFQKSKTLKSCTLATKNLQQDIMEYQAENVPLSIIANKTFLFGLCQASSRHMWEVCNQTPETDRKRYSPAVRLSDGTYIQLSYFPPDQEGLVLCWSNSANYRNIIDTALSFGCRAGLLRLQFVFYEEYSHLFEGANITDDNFTMVYFL